MNSQNDRSGCLQPTATIVAALIGLVGVLLTAWVSYTIGSKTSTNELEDLSATKDRKIAELSQVIEEKDATIREKDTTIRDLRAARPSPHANRPAEPVKDGSSKIASPPTPPVKEAPGLRVELLGCRLSGDELKCDFKATSTDRDKGVYLRRARLIDSKTSEIWPTMMQFGSSVSQGNHAPGSGKQVYAQMVRGIPIGGNVVFAGVDAASAPIPLIELSFDGLGAQFRDIQPPK